MPRYAQHFPFLVALLIVGMMVCPSYSIATEIEEIDSLKSTQPRRAMRLLDMEMKQADVKDDLSRFAHLKLLKSEIYYDRGVKDSALTSAWTLLRIVKKSNFNLDGKVYAMLGNIYNKIYLADSALYYFEKAYQVSNSSDLANRLPLLQKLSTIHKDQGSISKALEYSLKGIKYADSLRDAQYQGFFSKRLGEIYQNQGNFQKANSFYMQALEIHENNQYKTGIAATKQQIGSVFMKSKNYNEAETYFKASLDLYTELHASKGIADIYDYLGLMDYEKGNLQASIVWLKKSLTIRKEENNLADLPKSYVALANSYLKLKRYDDALNQTREGIGFTRKTGADVQRLDLFRQFYLIYKDLNYKDSALWYHERFMEFKDSLDRLENDELIIRLQNAYNTERRELELSEIKSKNATQQERIKYLDELKEKDNYLKLLLSSIIFILLILAGLLFSRYRIKVKANKLISRKVKENELLLTELHHRVKNNLQFISSLFSIKVQKIKDEESKIILEENLQKVRAMSLVHNLLNVKPEAGTNINLKKFIFGLTNSLVLSLGLDGEQLKLIYRWRKSSFNLDSVNAIGLVINEMITNSFKHADSDDLTIKIGFYENDKYQMIRYSDNGPGLSPDFFIGEKKMGISLMKLLVEDIGGVLRYSQPKDGETGIRISINIKK